MNSNNKAKQFLPFDALKGYKDAIKNKEKVVVSKKELSEDELEELSYTMQQIHKKNLVEIYYYKEDNYVLINGVVTNIDYTFKTISINKIKISFEDIKSIKKLE